MRNSYLQIMLIFTVFILIPLAFILTAGTIHRGTALQQQTIQTSDNHTTHNITFSSQSATQQATFSTSHSLNTLASVANCAGDSVVQCAQTQLGVPYCYGSVAPAGTTPSGVGGGSFGCNDGAGLTPGLSTTSGGFDCSGLVQWVYEQLGYSNFPRTTLDEWQSQNLIKHITQAQTQPGDLVWFYSFGDSGQPGHVGICIDAGCTDMINALKTGCDVSYYTTTSPCGSTTTPQPGALDSVPQCPDANPPVGTWCIMGYGHVTNAPTTGTPGVGQNAWVGQPDITINVPYKFTGSNPLQSSSQTPYPLSPSNAVYNYNNANALWLITCPVNPAADPSYQNPDNPSPYLFTTDYYNIGGLTPDFGYWFAAGDECSQPQGTMTLPVKLHLSDKLTQIPAGQLPTGTESQVGFKAENLAYLTLYDIGLSPQLDTGNGNVVSSYFNTQSYIFKGLPALGQYNIWTWNALFADSAYINQQITPPNPVLQATATETGTYSTTLSACTAAQNNVDALTYQGGDPNSWFTYVLSTSGWIPSTANINFLEALTLAEYQQGTASAWGIWNPLGMVAANQDPSNPLPYSACGTKTLTGLDGIKYPQDVYLHIQEGEGNLIHMLEGNACGSGIGSQCTCSDSSWTNCPPLKDYFYNSFLYLDLNDGNQGIAAFATALTCGLPAGNGGNSGTCTTLWNGHPQIGAPTSLIPSITPAVLNQLKSWGAIYQDSVTYSGVTSSQAAQNQQNLNAFLVSQLEGTNSYPGGGQASDNLGCSYTYTLNSQVTLDYIQLQQIPFPVGDQYHKSSFGQITYFNTPILPYFVFNNQVLNPNNNNNLALYYDVYSPLNYYKTITTNPSNVIDPYTVNSLSLFFSGYNNADGSSTYNGNLTFFQRSQLGIDAAVNPDERIGLQYPTNPPPGTRFSSPSKTNVTQPYLQFDSGIQNSTSNYTSTFSLNSSLTLDSSSNKSVLVFKVGSPSAHSITPLSPIGGSGSSGSTSPTGNPPPSGSTCPSTTTNAGTLTFDDVYACAWNAGFRGVQLAIMVSISYGESGFNSNDCSGLLGNALCGTTANTDCQSGQYCYNPATCPTGPNYWQNNPTCEFDWAFIQVEAYTANGGTCHNSNSAGYAQPNPPASDFCYWGTYFEYPLDGSFGTENGNPIASYCRFMPTGYTGDNCPQGENLNGFDWTSLGLANPGSGPGNIFAGGTGGPGGPFGGGGPGTCNPCPGGPPPPAPTPPPYTPTPINSTIAIVPTSITAIPSGYIFVLGTGPNPAKPPPPPPIIPLAQLTWFVSEAVSTFSNPIPAWQSSPGIPAGWKIQDEKFIGRWTTPITGYAYASGAGTVPSYQGQTWLGQTAEPFPSSTNKLNGGGVTCPTPIVSGEPLSSVSVPPGTNYNSEFSEAGTSFYIPFSETVTFNTASDDGIEIYWQQPGGPWHSLYGGSAWNYQGATINGPQTVTFTGPGDYNLVIDWVNICNVGLQAVSISGLNPYPQPADQPPEFRDTAMNIYVLKVIPTGYFNTSSYQPAVVPNSIDPNFNPSTYNPAPYNTYEKSWQDYWNNVLGLQAQTVYVVNVIPVGLVAPSMGESLPPGTKNCVYDRTSGNCDNYQGLSGFTPTNITADQNGDLYLSSYYNDPNLNAYDNWINEITNTVNNGDIKFISKTLCNVNVNTGSQDPPTGTNDALCNNKWPEIAVSPDGGQIYLANINSGYIPIYGGQNLKYEYSLSLDYSNDNSLISSSEVNPLAPPAANIIDYFANGGLYGVHAYSSPGKYCTSVNPSCSSADVQMAAIIKQEEADLNVAATQYDVGTYDQLDKVDWTPGSASNNNFHHPLAIQDVNGYLYVLDYWAGVTGEACTFTLGNICSPSLPFISGGSIGGIRFGLVMLRVINSSGVDIPIQPTLYNDLWYPCPDCGSSAGGVYAYNKFNQPSGLLYPPYGWVVTANLQSNGGSNPTLFLCGGGSNPTPSGSGAPFTQPPKCHGPDKSYQGSFKPIGPYLDIWGCRNIFRIGPIGYKQSCKMRKLLDYSMSVSFNNTVSIFMPSQENTGQSWGNNDGDIKNVANPNYYDTLIFVRFDPQNYTNQISGLNFLPFKSIDPNQPYENYKCYTSDKNAATNEKKGFDWNGAYCLYRGAQPNNEFNWGGTTSSIRSPILLFDNPFQFNENIGSYQSLTLEETASSDFNPNSAANRNGAGNQIKQISPNCNPPNNPTCVTNPFNEQANSQVIPGQLSTAEQTALQSYLNGYVIIPYSYTYTVTWWVSNIQSSASCTGAAPSALTNLETPRQYSQQIYNFSVSSNGGDTAKNAISNQEYSPIESDYSYPQSAVNTSLFYIPSISAIIVPQELFYNFLTNRQFGKVYINSTFTPYTNNQGVINATTELTYAENIYTQGANYPGYATIYQIPVNPVCIGVANQCEVPLANPNIYSIKNSLQNIIQNQALPVVLFDWYKIPVDDWNIFLTLNGSTGINKAYGYHRIVFVYNDRFNNTIYMPLDADIANLTQIVNFQATPTVDSTNANQTTVIVNGTLEWTPPYTTQTVPMKNGYVYLYYDANLNTIGYNAMDFAAPSVQTCVFSNTTVPDRCTYANPVYEGLMYNNTIYSTDKNGNPITAGLYPLDTPYISANIITYNQEAANCGPPPYSLFEPSNDIYTLCNIYNTNNHWIDTSGGPLVRTSKLTPYCPVAPSGAQQFCVPAFYNGTGICTAQLGLFAIAQTDQNGYFQTSINACGIGYHNIVAKFYGAPTPQPITAHQSVISMAANPSPSVPSIDFSALNYSWAPTTASTQVAIGTTLLSVGNINAPLAILIFAIIGAIAYAISHLKNGKAYKGKNRKHLRHQT